MNWIRKSIPALAVLALLAFVPALHAQGYSNTATTSLSYTSTEFATITVPASETFGPAVGGATPVVNFNITEQWSLASTRTQIVAAAWLGSATQALASGANGIPSSAFYFQQGGSLAACTFTDTGYAPTSIAGAGCNAWIPGGTFSLTGNVTEPINIQLQNLPVTLPTGTYTGTLYWEIQYM